MDFEQYLKEHIVKEKTLLPNPIPIPPFKLNPIEILYANEKHKPIGNWTTETQIGIKPIKEYILDFGRLGITKKTFKQVKTLINKRRLMVLGKESVAYRNQDIQEFYKDWRTQTKGKLFNPALGSATFAIKNMQNYNDLRPYLFYDENILKGIVIDYYTEALYGYRLVSFFLEERNGHRTPAIAEYGNLYALFFAENQYLNFGGDVGRSGLKKFKEKLCSEYLEVYHKKE